jgi:TolB protein
MSISPAPYFFMSYSREDTVKQKRIVKELRERGINLWVDIENLTPGSPTWEREIEKAIRGSMGIIVLLSPESNNSEWVRREISFGEQHRKRIFPVLIEGDDDTSTPLRLANHQRVDLRTKFEAGLDELATALKEYIGIKQEIATQNNIDVQQIRHPKPPLDLKKFGVPALIVLVGLVIIGGVISVVNKPNDVTPTSIVAIIVTTPPIDIDPMVTETKPVVPVTDEPTGKIVFTCQIQGDEICVMNADGSKWKQLTNSYSSYYASPSPDGKTVVFASKEEGQKFQLHEVDIATGKTVLIDIASLKMNDLDSPEISPDGNLIAFTNHINNNESQIWIADRDGKNAYAFYSLSNKNAHDPTWSPDGTQILFAIENQLYTTDFNGREPRLLNASINTRGRSDWSIGDLIVFDMGGSWAHDVYLMNPDGSDLHMVSPSGMNSQGASLSPDGKWIAFTAYTNVAKKDEKSCEIFVMRTDGTDVRQLTNNSYCDYQPRWGN